MWHAADLRDRLIAAGYYGHGEKGDKLPSFHWHDFMQKRDDYVKMLNGVYDRNLQRENVESHQGWGCIKDANTVEVTKDDQSTYELKTDHIVLAVGGRPTAPPDTEIPGASYGIDSNGFFELTEQPKKVVIVGAGYIAVELAGIFNTLGTETHLVIRRDKVLGKFDPDIQTVLTEWMEHTGVHIHKNSKVTKVEGSEKAKPVTVHTVTGEDRGKGKIEADVLIWAIGRNPNTENLGLGNVNIEVTEDGIIPVDEHQMTSVRNIHAIGDVTGQALLTPVAIAAGRRLCNRLFGPEKFKDQKLNYENIATVVFSSVIFFFSCFFDSAIIYLLINYFFPKSVIPLSVPLV